MKPVKGSRLAALLSALVAALLAPAIPAVAAAPQAKDFQAKIKQVKYFSDIGEEVTFYGSVAYARPGRMRWEFTEPDPSTLLIRPQDAWLIVPDIKQAQKIGERGRSRIDAFLLGFEKSWKDLEKDYRVERAGREDLPQGQADLIKLFKPGDTVASEIWVWWDEGRGIPLRVRWSNAQGDLTVTDFFDMRVDAGVDEKAFDLVIPKGFETTLVEGA